ncbi:MAG: alpha/beta fold hydrolase [Acidimicrobiales bacterium]
MSATAAPAGPLSGLLAHPGAAAVRRLSANAWGAGMLEAGIGYEAWLRAQRRLADGALASATGRRTVAQRRRAGERSARARLAPNRHASGRRAPVVHWHGPDRVRPGRSTVILVNGWAASGLVWPQALIERLERYADVVRIDNRGSGWSRTAPAPFTIGDLADDVAAVARAVGARRATVVGLSMGGMVAQEAALRHPGLVERLVLLGTRPAAPAGFAAAPGLIEGLVAPVRPGESARGHLARTWTSLTGPGFAERHPDRIAELVSQVLARPTPMAGVVDQLRAIAAWYGSGRLARLGRPGRSPVPAVVVHGAADRLIPVGNGMRLAQLVAGARYVELPGVGHLVPYEAPDAVESAVLGG